MRLDPANPTPPTKQQEHNGMLESLTS